MRNGKQKIKELLQEGKEFKEISYETGYSIAYVYRVSYEIGGQKKHKSKEDLIKKVRSKFEKQGLNPVKAQLFAENLTAKFEAKKTNSARDLLEFDLDLSKMDIPVKCPIYGMDINYDTYSRAPDSPTFDRIDPTKGYTMENTRIISCVANRRKQDSTLEDLQKIIDYIKINSC